MSQLVEQWIKDASRQAECSELNGIYELYSEKLFSDYEPLAIATRQTPRDFFVRLDTWLRNFKKDSDQWDAFNLVNDIFFVGRNELTELYRIAFDHIANEWLSQLVKVDYFDPQYQSAIDSALNSTWFCPITDSLKINSFRHINHIETPEYFPDWRSLEKFGDVSKIRRYISDRGIKQLILIEDVVGSGRQIKPAVEFAVQEFGIPVLVLPLLIGNRGHEVLMDMEQAHQNLTYEPVVVIPKEGCVTRAPDTGEPSKIAALRSLVNEFKKITGDAEPFGFEKDQGYLLVIHTNCPNNTIRPIHADLKNWAPLFPRSGRRSS